MSRVAVRSGFTLIEVLIALGLSVMLISAVYGAVEMYYRYQTAGRAEIRGQQMMRSLTRLIGRDIDCVVQPAPQPQTTMSSGQAADDAGMGTASTSGSFGSSSSSSGGSSSSIGNGSSLSGSSFDALAQGGTAQALTSGTASTFLGLEDAGLPVVFGIVGTETMLHLTTSLPSRDLKFVSISDTTLPTERSGDLQVVTIGLTTIDTLSMTMLQKNLKTTRPNVGLGRRMRDLFSPFDTDEALEPQHLIAPEVTELGFRYFDSGAWATTWDSVMMGRLPRAIEIDLGFWNPPVVRVGGSKSLDAGTITHVQYVFKVPIAEPIVN